MDSELDPEEFVGDDDVPSSDTKNSDPSSSLAVDYINGRTKDLTKEEIEQLIEEAFHDARSRGYPYLPRDQDLIQREFRKLMKSDAAYDSTNKVIKQTSTGIRLANTYHPEMMNVRCRGRKWTPLDVFNDDVKFRLAIGRFLKYGGIFTPAGIRMATCMERDSQAVGNFRPTAARAIYSRFQQLGPLDLVVDFCAGWGGRMVGALSMGLNYVGIDPNTVSLAANQELANDICKEFPSLPKPELVCACAEDVLGKGRWNPDLIFTSPPYFDVEKYSDEETQSYKRHPTIDKWYEGFLGACIRGAYHDLKPGGHLALNINPDMGDETKKIGLATGFEYVETIGLAMSRRQYRKKLGMYAFEPENKDLAKYRYEPTLVFRKGPGRDPFHGLEGFPT